jgi:hypothetical protein
LDRRSWAMVSPVIFLPILPPLLTCHACAVLNQARTLRASQNVLLECRQCLHGLGVPSQRHVEQHSSSFLVVGEGLAPVIRLYRSKLLCFTRELSIAVAPLDPLDYSDGQLLWIHSFPPTSKTVAVASLDPPKRLTGVPLG